MNDQHSNDSSPWPVIIFIGIVALLLYWAVLISMTVGERVVDVFRDDEPIATLTPGQWRAVDPFGAELEYRVAEDEHWDRMAEADRMAELELELEDLRE